MILDLCSSSLFQTFSYRPVLDSESKGQVFERVKGPLLLSAKSPKMSKDDTELAIGMLIRLQGE